MKTSSLPAEPVRCQRCSALFLWLTGPSLCRKCLAGTNPEVIKAATGGGARV